MAKCLLVDPPSFSFNPLTSLVALPSAGLVAVSSWLTRCGHDVAYLDCKNGDIGFQDIVATLESYAPDVVGVTAYSMDIYSAMAVCSLAKRTRPSVHTVVGGYHASALPELTLLTCHDIDICVVGAGEHTAEDLLALAEEGKPWTADLLRGIPGLAFRTDGKTTYRTPNRPLLTNLDELPCAYMGNLRGVDYEFPFRTRAVRGNPGFALSFSRGCTGNCIYCSNSAMWKRTWRSRSPELMVQELALAQEHGLKHFFFCDNDFLVEPRRVERFLNLVEEKGLSIRWAFETSTNSVLRAQHLLPRMKRLGFFLCLVGYEFASQARLDRTGKRWASIELSEKAASILRNEGVFVVALGMVGFPDETRQTVAEYVEFFRSLRPQVLYTQCLTALPGTRLFAQFWKEDRIDTLNFGRYDLMTPTLRYEHITRDEMTMLHSAVSDAFLLPGFEAMQAMERRGELDQTQMVDRWAAAARILQAFDEGRVDLDSVITAYFAAIEGTGQFSSSVHRQEAAAVGADVRTGLVRRIMRLDERWRQVQSEPPAPLTAHDAETLVEKLVERFPPDALARLARTNPRGEDFSNLWYQFLFPDDAQGHLQTLEGDRRFLEQECARFFAQQEMCLKGIPGLLAE